MQEVLGRYKFWVQLLYNSTIDNQSRLKVDKSWVTRAERPWAWYNTRLTGLDLANLLLDDLQDERKISSLSDTVFPISQKDEPDGDGHAYGSSSRYLPRRTSQKGMG